MTIYLIDSENVANDWASLVPDMDETSHVVLYYGPASASIPPVLLHMLSKKRISIEFVQCLPGPNAMDFQIVTDLGYRICSYPNDTYVLVTKDAGFDAAIHFWSQQGADIFRRQPIRVGGHTPCSTPQAAPAAKAEPKIPVNPQPQKTAPAPTKPDTAAQKLDKRRKECYLFYHTHLLRFTKVKPTEMAFIIETLMTIMKLRKPLREERLKTQLMQEFGAARYNTLMTANLKKELKNIMANGPTPP